MGWRSPFLTGLATLGVAALYVSTLLALPVAAVELGQIDDFEDGTTMGWAEGPLSPNPPQAVDGGGPDGDRDGYLANTSSGSPGPGGRQVTFNAAQWAGDYVAAGVGGIRAYMRNTGNAPLAMRIALQDAGQTRFGSTTAVILPDDGEWHRVSFGLAAEDLTRVAGLADLSEVLTGVVMLRILSAFSGPRWEGDQIVSTLGVDDVEAVAGPPVATEAATWGGIKSRFGPRP